MALKQVQLREVAEEALNALRAYEELASELRRTLATSLAPGEKCAVLAHVLAEQPLVACEAAARALEHIARTSERNQKRAAAARRERRERNGRE